MRILIVVDNQPSSYSALVVGAKLGANLWAHVNLLTVVPQYDQADYQRRDSIKELLVQARQTFIDQCGPEAPFLKPGLKEEAIMVRPGLLDFRPMIVEGKKELKLRARVGELGREVLEEAYEEMADLIIMGASLSDSATENGEAPLRVASQAACSILIIKEAVQVENIIIGLENPQLSQTAREMFNQMTTIFSSPAAMYPLPSFQGDRAMFDEAMHSLVKIFKAHDLNVVTAEGLSAELTIAELYGQARHNLLILR